MTVQLTDTYAASIRRLAELRSDEWISNDKPEHAQALYHTFFDIAKRKVLIFCRNLAREVFDAPALISAAEAAVRRGVELHVVVQTEPDRGNGFYERLLVLAREMATVSVRILSPDGATESRANFCVVDSKALRYEANSGEIKAVAAMHRPDIGSILSLHFEQIHATALPLSSPVVTH